MEQLEDMLADEFQVPRHTLHLRTVENGCLQLTLLVSRYISDEMFPLTTEQEAALRKIGVTDLQCGTHRSPCQVVHSWYCLASYTLGMRLGIIYLHASMV